MINYCLLPMILEKIEKDAANQYTPSSLSDLENTTLTNVVQSIFIFREGVSGHHEPASQGRIEPASQIA